MLLLWPLESSDFSGFFFKQITRPSDKLSPCYIRITLGYIAWRNSKFQIKFMCANKIKNSRDIRCEIIHKLIRKPHRLISQYTFIQFLLLFFTYLNVKMRNSSTASSPRLQIRLTATQLNKLIKSLIERKNSVYIIQDYVTLPAYTQKDVNFE
ncbi:hypothetical protein PUN28_005484 [Cardiocondyla obscurior]|uniref:Uncharacterized protein n=1 Tax=Cardiocondyla obscurior TaxID=286306 RepID=A0AAW2GL42_9HYME